MTPRRVEVAFAQELLHRPEYAHALRILEMADLMELLRSVAEIPQLSDPYVAPFQLPWLNRER